MDPSTESADSLPEVTERCAECGDHDESQVVRGTVMNQVGADPGTPELQNQLR